MRREEEFILGCAEGKGFVVFSGRFWEVGMELSGEGWAGHVGEGSLAWECQMNPLRGEGLREK